MGYLFKFRIISVKDVIGYEKCYYQHQTSTSHIKNNSNSRLHRSLTFPWQNKIIKRNAKMYFRNFTDLLQSAPLYRKIRERLENATVISSQNAIKVYYKILFFITKWVSFITKCDNFLTKCNSYCKMERLLQKCVGINNIT